MQRHDHWCWLLSIECQIEVKLEEENKEFEF